MHFLRNAKIIYLTMTITAKCIFIKFSIHFLVAYENL